jgi:DNA-binding HxlR family transcriptional regulator
MGELEESTNILQPPLSQQLTVLRNENIVSVRKSS